MAKLVRAATSIAAVRAWRRAANSASAAVKPACPRARPKHAASVTASSSAIALAVALRDAGEELPAALHAVSPFCDLTIRSESTLAGADPWLGRDRLRILAASYVHAADPATPLISPVLAELRGLPPLLVEVAAQEALRDDAVALAAAAAAAGVATTLEIVPDSVHSFVLFAFLEESERALQRFAEHVRQSVPLARP